MSGGLLQASEPAKPPATPRRRIETPLPGWIEYLGVSGWTKVIILAVLIGWLYWAEFTRMYTLWKSPDWSHGFLIPVFSLYIINLRKKELILGDHPGSIWGIVAIAISLAVYIRSILLQMGYPQSLSVIATIGGLVLLLRGWRSLWTCFFPIGFLLLAIPPPERYYRALTQPLQQLAAAIATLVLNAFPGAEVTREGINLNYLMNSGLEGTFTVAGACSGMRSLMAFVALGLATAYFAPRPPWQRAAMAIAVVPVAVFCNVLRVIITGSFQMYGHADLASGTPHAILGFAMFGLGFVIYLGIQWMLDHLLIETNERRLSSRFMHTTRNNIYFAMAVLMLGSCAAWLQAKSSSGTLLLIKKALPIRKLLIDMDRDAIAPYQVIKAERLPPEVIENLGTEEYLSWVLSPRGKADNRPIHLTVTYYTGVQDQIPHVPEECLYQGGMTQDTDDTLALHLTDLGEDVPVRRLSFRSPKQVGQKLVIYYTICVNGSFCADRLTARFKMGNLSDSHLYYSKVELALDGSGEADLAAMDNRASEVLDRTLMELRKSHWPPKGSERGGSSPAADATTRS